MRRIIYSILPLILFSSCIKFKLFDDDKLPYYKFTEEDKAYLPTVYSKLNEEKKYISKDGNTLSTKTLRYDFAKNRRGNLKYSIPPHFFDKLDIELTAQNTNDSCNTIKISFHKNESGVVNSWIEFPSNRHPHCIRVYYTFELPEEKDSVTSIMINNKTYHHVLNFVHSHYPFNIGNNTQIDKVLYDLKEGIIGFDDTKNDIQFRLVN